MSFDLTLAWTALLAFSIAMYVLLDGFDLGIGMLFPFAPDDATRDSMIETIAPIWDGNETWLVFGSISLFAAFPVAFAIVVPALYFPFLIMLLGLIFRGVAFEFRMKSLGHGRFWNWAFFAGSAAATFAQGIVAGAFVAGFAVNGHRFVGGNFDWLRPFPVLVGLSLCGGYVLLGATWLVMKTEGAQQQWARRMARLALIAVLGAIVAVSLWTPFLRAEIATRWFSWPEIALLSPVPLVTAAIALWLVRSLAAGGERAPFVAALGLFLMCFLGLAISLWPYVVPPSITLVEAAASAASQRFIMAGAIIVLPVVLASTAWSYFVFRGKIRSAGELY